MHVHAVNADAHRIDAVGRISASTPCCAVQDFEAESGE